MKKIERKIETKEFLEAIYSEYFQQHKGFINIRELDKGPRDTFCESIQAVIDKFFDEGFVFTNTCFGVAPRAIEDGSKDGVKHVTALWLDVDYGVGGHKKPSPFNTAEEAWSVIEAFSFEPSIIVNSGHGYHCYWLLDTIREVSDFEEIEGIHKGLIQCLGGDTGTHNIDKILRMPNTLNDKEGCELVEVVVEKFNPEMKYCFNDFEQFRVLEQVATPRKKVDVKFSEEVSSVDVDSLPLALWVKELIRKGKSKKHPSRSEADYAVISAMLDAGCQDDEICAIFEGYKIGEKYRESRGNGYLERSIKKAKINQFKSEIHVRSEQLKVHDVVKEILCQHVLIYCGGQFYEYQDGYYQAVDEEQVRQWVLGLLGEGYSKSRAGEVIGILQASTYIKIEKLNATNDLNLINTVLSASEGISFEHDKDFYSTIRLDVVYDETAKCPKWEKTLDEIFEGDFKKAEMLQEFFGLCLTTEVKYEKALFMVGDGANGKSLILRVLERLVGSSNRSAVAVDDFKNKHYLASLHRKLVNITIEANAKSCLHEAMLKAVISGDLIHVDAKYNHPFSFRPFCKLVFAVNNMPMTFDKSDGLFRKILILRFEKKFSEESQNRELFDVLLDEISGILIWSLEGLRRLQKRGHFDTSVVAQEVGDYRKESNSVMQFVEDKCQLNVEAITKKADIYSSYSSWCRASGLVALSISDFAKELKRLHPSTIGEDRDSKVRYWTGIATA